MRRRGCRGPRSQPASSERRQHAARCMRPSAQHISTSGPPIPVPLRASGQLMVSTLSSSAPCSPPFAPSLSLSLSPPSHPGSVDGEGIHELETEVIAGVEVYAHPPVAQQFSHPAFLPVVLAQMERDKRTEMRIQAHKARSAQGEKRNKTSANPSWLLAVGGQPPLRFVLLRHFSPTTPLAPDPALFSKPLSTTRLAATPGQL